MKLKIEYHYFEGCPNHKIMSENLKKALEGLDDKIVLSKIKVEDTETAKQVNFRGSPTLLIDGEDVEQIPVPSEPSLSCRYYLNGIPSVLEIRNMIQEKLNRS